MKLTRDIQSLSVFKRDTSKFLRQMKESGQPLVLTVNGKPAAVVIDPEDFELMRERERVESIAAVNRGIADMKERRTRPAEDVFNDLFKRFNIPEKE